MKLLFKIYSLFIIALLLIIISTSCKNISNDSAPATTQLELDSKKQNNKSSKTHAPSILSVHFLDVGQGNATLIESDGH